MSAVTLPDRRVVLATAHSAWPRVRLWDAVSGQPWGEPLEADAGVTALAVVIDAAGAELLAVGDKGGTVRIWDVESGGEAAAPRPGHPRGVRSMVALPDACLGVAAHDGSVRVWRLGDDGPPRMARGPGEDTQIELRAVFAPDGTTRTVFTSHVTRSVVEDLKSFLRAGLWDPSADMPSGHLLSESYSWAYRGADFAGWCSAGGAVRLAIASVGIEVCDVRPSSLQRPSWDLGRSVNKVEVFAGPDGTPWLAAGGSDGTVRLLDLETGLQARSPLFGHTGAIQAITAFRGPDGRPMLATGCDDGDVRVWDLTRAQDDTALPPSGHSSRVTVRTPPPVDGAPTLVATYGEGDQTVRLWDQSTGESVGEPFEVNNRHKPSRATAILIWVPLPEGGFGIACGTKTEGLHLWSAHTGRSVRWPSRALRSQALGHAKNAVMFTDRDGRHVLAMVLPRYGHRSTVRLWDATTGQPLRRRGLPVRIRLPEYEHTFTVFTGPEGRNLIAGAAGRAARGIGLWNGLTGSRVGVLAPPETTHPSRPQLLTTFRTEDGTVLLAAVGDTNDVRIWNPWTGDLVAEPDSGHTGKVHTVVTLPGSPARLASGGQDGTLRIWEPLTGTVVDTLHTGAPIHDLAIGSAGTLFLAGPGGLTAVDPESRTDEEEPRPDQA